MTGHNVLVTGGAGYIGSHTCIALLKAGYMPIILDNLSNADRIVLDRLERITGHAISFYADDVQNTRAVQEIISRHSIQRVIHFAAHKAVAESVQNPLLYYRNNVGGLLSVLAGMQQASATAFVYSSSATVYAPDATGNPLAEDAPCGPINPYGHTKLMGEQIIADFALTWTEFRSAILRYFNPVGAHESGLIGENPRGIPNNLMPYITQVAAGERDRLTIFGTDYPTPDGTAIRDYIHVMDVAEAHVAALRHLDEKRGTVTLNLGTGRGVSVREMVETFEKVNSVSVSRVDGPRRAGDAASVCADPARAHQTLNWRATRDLDSMCRDAWRYQRVR